jgi:hypothetical protein
MPKHQTHVVPDPKSGWNVKHEHAERASIHTNTKQEAVDRGRNLSRKQETEFIIHNKDGKIAIKDSHGPDSPKDKG